MNNSPLEHLASLQQSIEAAERAAAKQYKYKYQAVPGHYAKNGPESMDDTGCECHREKKRGEALCLSLDCWNVAYNFECRPNECREADCFNQGIRKGLFMPTEVRPTAGRGLGLFLCGQVATLPGQLLVEYRGRRLDGPHEYARLLSEGKHQYIMRLPGEGKGGGECGYIDARERGSLGRFANHSCDPSARFLSKVVHGWSRVGIFARRRIEPGEEVTVHYGLLPPSSGPQGLTECLCGCVAGVHSIEESRSPDEGEELYGRWGKRSGQVRPPTNATNTMTKAISTPIATAVGGTVADLTPRVAATRAIRGPSSLLRSLALSPDPSSTRPEMGGQGALRAGGTTTATRRGSMEVSRPLRRGGSILMYHRPPTPPPRPAPQPDGPV